MNKQREKKLRQTKRQIKEMLKDFEALCLKNAERAVKSSMITPEIMEAENYVLAKAVLDGTMQDRPFKALGYKKDFENIRLSF